MKPHVENAKPGSREQITDTIARALSHRHWISCGRHERDLFVLAPDDWREKSGFNFIGSI